MTAIEVLFSILRDTNATLQNKPLRAVHFQYPDGTSRDFLDVITELFAEAKSEIEICSFNKQERRGEYLEFLGAIKSAIYQHVTRRSEDATGHLVGDALMARLQGVSENVAENLNAETADIDRNDFSKSTLNLIETVKEWDIDQFAKRSLLLSLELVANQLTAEKIASSDYEIRSKIQAIVARFAVEFCELDREFETKLQTLKRWARLGYSGAAKPLGLTYEVIKALPKS